MKIALVILHADPARGGAERYTFDLAAALARRGHDISLVATTFSELPKGVKKVELPATGATRTGRYVRMLDALDEHVTTGEYDVVHAMLPVRQCDVYHPHAGLAVAAVENASAFKRLLNPRRGRFAEVERELLQSGNPPVVLCLSEYVKRDVQRHYPRLPPNKLATLFNAVDLSRFDPATTAPAQQPRKRAVALMIAQDFLRKGLRETIEALALMEPTERPQLTVVGKGDSMPFQRLARSLRIDSFITFEGPVADPIRYYRTADFFVLPTKHDPCSLVVLEALAMGLPVISTVFNGACEIMTDGVHGFVLPDPRNTRAIADAMKKMLDPQRRAEMSKACLELRPRLSYERHVDRLLEIYGEIQSART